MGVAAGAGRHAVGEVAGAAGSGLTDHLSSRHGEVDVVGGLVDGFGDETHQKVQGGDQVVGADPDAGAVGVVFVAPELGPVALEEWVVGPRWIGLPSLGG